MSPSSDYKKRVSFESPHYGYRLIKNDGTWGVIYKESRDESNNVVSYHIIYPKLGNYPVYFFDKGDWSQEVVDVEDVFQISDAVQKFIYQTNYLVASEGDKPVGTFVQHCFGYEGNFWSTLDFTETIFEKPSDTVS